MDAILQLFITWQFLFFGLAVATIMYVIRIILEFAFPIFIKSIVWTNLILPLLPVFLGLFGSLLLTSFPYPDGLVSTENRGIFGLVAGLLSTLLYRVVKSLLIQKIQIVIPTENPEAPVNPPADIKTVETQITQGLNK